MVPTFRSIIAASLLAVCGLAAFGGTKVASNLAGEINRASPNGANDKGPLLIAKTEVLLDRAHFSAGEVDGFDGDNFRRAIRAFQEVHSLATTRKLDRDTWSALGGNDSRLAIRSYTISDADVAGPFTKAIPADLSDMAKLPGLSYLRPLSEIAEKFHMSQSLLRRLNPGVDFSGVGTVILVADVSEMKLRAGANTVEAVSLKETPNRIATTVIVDKPANNVRAYDRSGRL